MVHLIKATVRTLLHGSNNRVYLLKLSLDFSMDLVFCTDVLKFDPDALIFFSDVLKFKSDALVIFSDVLELDLDDPCSPLGCPGVQI